MKTNKIKSKGKNKNKKIGKLKTNLGKSEFGGGKITVVIPDLTNFSDEISEKVFEEHSKEKETAEEKEDYTLFKNEVEEDLAQPVEEFLSIKCPMCKTKFSLTSCRYHCGNPVCPSCGYCHL